MGIGWDHLMKCSFTGVRERQRAIRVLIDAAVATAKICGVLLAECFVCS